MEKYSFTKLRKKKKKKAQVLKHYYTNVTSSLRTETKIITSLYFWISGRVRKMLQNIIRVGIIMIVV